MSHHTTDTNNRVAWIDLNSSDAPASRDFYGKLFGWDIEVTQDPQYGGYGMARQEGEDVAGIGPAQDPNAPTAWSLYFGSKDLDAFSKKVTDAGGTVVMAPFDVGDQGRMAVYQDPTGAFFSAWQGERMGTFRHGHPNSFGWAEVNARGVEQAVDFYSNVLGWQNQQQPMGDDLPPYNEFHLGDHAVAGAWEMSPEIPAEVPSYWQVYFKVDDVDDTFRRATDLGASPMVPPSDYPGGRFAILVDPQGASFAIHQTQES
ncbi:MAG TPA: VOC family protein [Candidatus Limnocylindrales bacterium]|nr:VOC family protein [Candidatus Limnocylindrales bacterium]